MHTQAKVQGLWCAMLTPLTAGGDAPGMNAAGRWVNNCGPTCEDPREGIRLPRPVGRISMMVVAEEARSGGVGAALVADDPYLYFARLTRLWKARHAPAEAAGPRIHPSAVVDPQAEVHPTARIGALCVVERGAQIGAHTWLKSRVTVGEDCQIGRAHV